MGKYRWDYFYDLSKFVSTRGMAIFLTPAIYFYLVYNPKLFLENVDNRYLLTWIVSLIQDRVTVKVIRPVIIYVALIRIADLSRFALYVRLRYLLMGFLKLRNRSHLTSFSARLTGRTPGL